MEIIKKSTRMKSICRSISKKGKTIGFVPTMGAFHEGHLSLIRKSKQLSDITIVSIYVNPAQFAKGEDFDKYPSNITGDADYAVKERVDYLFTPNSSDIYPSGYKTYVNVEELSSLLCGVSRPDHFRGVCTVVLKLLNIINPNFAFFGMKDAQQALIIKRMACDLALDVEIVVEPIVREEDGLAMSSRNSFLNKIERTAALSLFQGLTEARSMIEKGENRSEVIIRGITKCIDKHPQNKIDYICIVEPETLLPLEKIKNKALIALAVFVGKTRLIDNILIER